MDASSPFLRRACACLPLNHSCIIPESSLFANGIETVLKRYSFRAEQAELWRGPGEGTGMGR